MPSIDRAAAQQRLLATAAESATSLAAMLRAALGIATDLNLMVPNLNHRLTTTELWNPQQSWERSLHNSLSAPADSAPVTRDEASQVLFWFACSTAWLESGAIEDPPAPSLTRRSLDAVLQADPVELNDQQRRLLDDASREVLRRLGGIPHVRSGHNNHLLDCPTARAWWRVEIARQAADNSDDQLSLDDCYEAFLSRGCWRAWTTTAMTMAGRLSAGQCAAGFAAAVRAHQNTHGDWPSGQRAAEFAFNIARRSAGHYAGMLDYRTLAQLAQ